MEKLTTAEAAVESVLFDGAVVMVGGFGLVGMPLTLVSAINASALRDLTIISNNLAEPGRYLGKALLLGKVRHAIGTYFTTNPDVVRAYAEGRIECTVLPQGTCSE